MNHQDMKEMFDGYMNEMEKQTAILKHLEEQQEIIIEQNAKISATLGRLAEHVQITFSFWVWSIALGIISLYYPFMKEAAMPLFFVQQPLFQPITYLTMRD